MKIEHQALSHQSQYSDDQRKLLGVHYTPDAIVEYIIRFTLRPYLEKNNLEAIRNITIVDPACGSGLFLLKAFDTLCSFWKQHLGCLHARDAQYILENNLYGVDIDVSAVNAAKTHLTTRAKELGVKTINVDHNICQGDALVRPFSQPRLAMIFNAESSSDEFDWHQKFPQIFARGGFDCVVGNPPYIRIQHVQPPERRAKYVEIYQTARGRFDIAGLFIELANSLVKHGGRIGYIVSNKLLSTSGASELRSYILTHYRLVEIVNLSDTKMFAASVLPMILVMEKRPTQGKLFVHASIKEIKEINQTLPPPSVESLLEPLEQAELPPLRIDVEWEGRYFRIEKFESPLPTHHQRVWTFHYPSERRIIEKLRENAVRTLGSIAHKISVGLKTTADDVFIKRMTLDFLQQNRLEQEIVFPILESHNIQRWKCDWKPERDLYVLYPHREQNGKVLPVCLDLYPNVERYLLSHRKQLEARTYLKASGRQWYEIWVHQSPRDFEQIKLITPDIAPHNCFALDDQKYFVNGTCFYIILKDQSLNYNLLILALLNSRVLEFFHKATSGNVLYAKRFRYWTSYLKTYPICDIAQPKHSAIVKQLIENTRKLMGIVNEQKRISLERENDRLVYQLYGLTDQEVEELESFLLC